MGGRGIGGRRAQRQAVRDAGQALLLQVLLQVEDMLQLLQVEGRWLLLLRRLRLRRVICA